MLVRPLIALVLALVAFTGCRQASNLNTPCNLVKRDPADGGVLIITENEITLGANKDFISFGSVECEDFVCVRDSNFPRDPDPKAPAQGYCSKSCLQGSSCPSFNPADDEQVQALSDGGFANRKLSCRPLLLDAEAIGGICAQSPEVAFCTVKSPYFCARGGNADAGT